MSVSRELPRFAIDAVSEDGAFITPNREAWRYWFAGQALCRPQVGSPRDAVDFADRLLRKLENTKGEEDVENEE